MKFLRYPGGKQRLLAYLINYLPTNEQLKGRYVEPFIGGGSVFFHVHPQRALLSDLNTELIMLYKGIKRYPHKVWQTFASFPTGKSSYYQVRDQCLEGFPLYYKAARTLYLNRTCFKGMWRHNNRGNFTVGYGGEERRWVITHENITELSGILRKTEIFHADFQPVIESTEKDDFIFLDPPYKPGEKDLLEAHYIYGKFSFDEQKRLAHSLFSIPSSKNVKWAMTNSLHEDILRLYAHCNIRKIPVGTGAKPGILTKDSKEVLITNY